jgi:hypothetical protein
LLRGSSATWRIPCVTSLPSTYSVCERIDVVQLAGFDQGIETAQWKFWRASQGNPSDDCVFSLAGCLVNLSCLVDRVPGRLWSSSSPICFDCVGLVRGMGGLMYMVIRRYSKVHSVTDAARRARTGIAQILKGSPGFRSYYLMDAGEGVGVAVMIFEDGESANAANNKVLAFVRASLHDLDLGDPEIIAGEVLVNMESDA